MFSTRSKSGEADVGQRGASWLREPATVEVVQNPRDPFRQLAAAWREAPPEPPVDADAASLPRHTPRGQSV